MDSSYKVLPLFKSHYSIGKSILTLDEPYDKKKKPKENSIINMLVENKLPTLVLVDDSISGLLEASKNCKDNKIQLVFGLRISITNDMTQKSDESLKQRAKYIIFVKNKDGYKDLIKIWSLASTSGFYYEPCIDFTQLRKLWNEKNLKLVVPFYDSFLMLNSLESHKHVPDFSFTKPVFLWESNDVPFDDTLKVKVDKLCQENKYPLLQAQSIFYKKPSDFLAYITFKCISHGTELDKPELDHMSSDEFNFSKWLKLNE